MHDRKTLTQELRAGALNGRIEEVYGCVSPQTEGYAERLAKVAEGFDVTFPENKASEIGLYSAPGRTEIGGNHTDHQCGCVLAASVNLDAVAAAAPNGKNSICFYSEGYGMIEVDLADTEPVESEKESTASLIRGMAAQARARGFDVSGFDAYCTSSVLGGSGLSSSAAFETLTGVILNDFYCNNTFDAVEIAKMGQKAENIWFGKPSGLMDQSASSVGGVVAIDFADVEKPVVEKIDLNLAKEGYALCIIDSRSSHADLTDAYAGIPMEMKGVAAIFGQTYLRGITARQLMEKTAQIREQCGDRAFLRAMHFVLDNERAQQEAQALREGDFDRFLEIVNASGHSSYEYLQNTAVEGSVRNQAVNVALALCDVLLAGRGAHRVHGGGFAGTVQAFVPLDMLETFRAGIDAAIGEGSCHVLSIRPVGGAIL
ncbi:MAG: galactokinase family protein [Eubacteriales bacterium]|nr:galactokinase family protein [Eubacteriales bacterium]